MFALTSGRCRRTTGAGPRPLSARSQHQRGKRHGSTTDVVSSSPGRRHGCADWSERRAPDTVREQLREFHREVVRDVQILRATDHAFERRELDPLMVLDHRDDVASDARLEHPRRRLPPGARPAGLQHVATAVASRRRVVHCNLPLTLSRMPGSPSSHRCTRRVAVASSGVVLAAVTKVASGLRSLVRTGLGSDRTHGARRSGVARAIRRSATLRPHEGPRTRRWTKPRQSRQSPQSHSDDTESRLLVGRMRQSYPSPPPPCRV